MGYSIYEGDNGRDCGYGVPCLCDHPECEKEIDRGLAYVCGGEPFERENSCGLYFCGDHLGFNDDNDSCKQYCERCLAGKEPFEPKVDIAEWVNHKLTDESWKSWRMENPEEVAKMKLIYKLEGEISE